MTCLLLVKYHPNGMGNECPLKALEMQISQRSQMRHDYRRVCGYTEFCFLLYYLRDYERFGFFVTSCPELPKPLCGHVQAFIIIRYVLFRDLLLGVDNVDDCILSVLGVSFIGEGSTHSQASSWHRQPGNRQCPSPWPGPCSSSR